MRAAPSRASLLALLVTASCGADFAPRSVLQDLRVLAILAAPLEVGPGESVTLRAVTVPPPGGSLAAERWTFCPFSIGASAGYACAVPACETTLSPVSPASGYESPAVTAVPSLLAQACLDLVAPGLPVELPEKTEVLFRYVVKASNGTKQVAVQRIPLHRDPLPAGQERNLAPVILSVEIGEERVWPLPPARIPVLLPGGSLDVRVLLTPESAQPYEEGGRDLTESLVVSFYSTAGRFDFDRANGPDARVKLGYEEIAPGTPEALVWVVARDLRGGQAVVGPLTVTLAP
jgi:hypothetical protein